MFGKQTNYKQVGVFVVFFTVTLIWFAIWLSSGKDSGDYLTYDIYAKGDVSGLSAGSSVRFSGVRVGRVKSLHLDKNDPQSVVVRIEVTDTAPISTATIATINQQGITGEQSIALKSTKATGATLMLQPGQRYPVIPFVPSLITRLSQAIRSMTSQVEGLGSKVSQLLGQKNQRAFAGSLENIQTITENLADNSKQMTAIMRSTNEILKNTANVSQRFPEAMQDLHATLQEISRSAKHMTQAANHASQALSSADNVLTDFHEEVLPGIQQFTSSLGQIGHNVSQFTGELKQHPSILIRGRRIPTPGPGE